MTTAALRAPAADVASLAAPLVGAAVWAVSLTVAVDSAGGEVVAGSAESVAAAAARRLAGNSETVDPPGP